MNLMNLRRIKMTVGELITELKKYDSKTKIFYQDDDGCYFSILSVSIDEDKDLIMKLD